MDSRKNGNTLEIYYARFCNIFCSDNVKQLNQKELSMATKLHSLEIYVCDGCSQRIKLRSALGPDGAAGISLQAGFPSPDLPGKWLNAQPAVNGNGYSYRLHLRVARAPELARKSHI